MEFFNFTDTWVVAGREMNLYFDSLMRGADASDIYLICENDTIPWPRLMYMDECIRFHVTTEDLGDHEITVRVMDKRSSEEIDRVTVKVHIIEDKKLEQDTHIMFLGDSLTEARSIQNELHNMLGEHFIMHGTMGDFPNNHEGRSAWSARSYLEEQVFHERTNPFYNPDKEGEWRFDFAYYLKQHPDCECLDYVSIFLGRNDGYGNMLPKLDYIIANIRESLPNVRIMLMLGYDTGLINSGCGRYKQNTWLFKEDAIAVNKEMAAHYGGREKEGIWLVDLQTNLDTMYDYPHIMEPVSFRNPEPVFRQDNNVHPNVYGYYKMADVWYARFIGILRGL